MKATIVKKIKSAPKDPGVYIFRAGSQVLYVGKAANLRARLKSYLKITDVKTESLHEETSRLEYIILRSEIEALIEEARLIKSLKPKYNVLLSDDKSYNYVAFTKEKFPKVFITHKNLHSRNYKLKVERIGPFTDGKSLRIVIKLLRRICPFCTCFQSHLRDCLNAQIGKCPGYCCLKNTVSDNKEYRKIIRKIKMVLTGQSKRLIKQVKDERERAALENIFEHRPFITFSTRKKISDFPEGFKIEAYDISNFAGKEAVGAMTALVRKHGVWMSDKNSYRKFKIKSAPNRDDPRMIEEVVSRMGRCDEEAL